MSDVQQPVQPTPPSPAPPPVVPTPVVPIVPPTVTVSPPPVSTPAPVPAPATGKISLFTNLVSSDALWLHIITIAVLTCITVLAAKGIAIPQVLYAIIGGSLGGALGITVPGSK